MSHPSHATVMPSIHSSTLPFPSPQLSLCYAVHVPSFPHASSTVPFQSLLTLIADSESTQNDPQTQSAATFASTTAATAVASVVQSKIMRFHFEIDRTRALLAKLLSMSVLSVVTGRPLSSLRFRRTAYGKPFLLAPTSSSIAAAPQTPSSHVHDPSPAFNLSHHGDWVVLVVEANLAAASSSATSSAASSSPTAASSLSSFSPLPLLGCDITTCALPHGIASVAEYFDCMRDCFTEKEWTCIRDTTEDESEECIGQEEGGEKNGSASTSASSTMSATDRYQLIRFSWYWSLKESLIKAIGIGLSFQLQHIEFLPATESRRVFAPVTVQFLGEPTFAASPSTSASAAPASSSPTSPSKRSPSSALRTPPPPDLDGITDLRELQWRFESCMLRDKKHVVSRARAWRKKNDQCSSDCEVNEKATEAASSSSSASGEPSPTSVFDLDHPSQLSSLGVDISLTTNSTATSSSSLRVYQLQHSQIMPKHLT